MVDVTIRENITEQMDKLGDEMNPKIAKLLLKAADFAGREIATTAMATFKDPTGALARSFLPARFVQSSEGIAAAAVSDLPYAEIQDVGGVITPKNADHLAIPLTSVAKKQNPREWPAKRLFFLEIKRTRNKFLAERVGSKLRFHYLLRERVRIPATNYLSKAMEAAEPEINDIIEQGVQQLINETEAE